MPSGIYLGWDRMLPSRIKKYADSNMFVDVDVMVDSLQKEYRNDYGRRKRKAFRVLVNKVYQSMLAEGELEDSMLKMEEYEGLTVDEVLDSSQDEEDNEINLNEYDEDSNLLNQSLMNIYSKMEDVQTFVPSRSPQYFEQQHKNKALKQKELNANRDSKSNKAKKLKNKNDSNNNRSDTLPHKPPHDGAGESLKRKKVQIKEGKKKRRKQLTEEASSDVTDDTKSVKGKLKKQFELQLSNVTFADVAGNDKSLKELARLLLHMSHPEIYLSLGVSPPRGVLLHGPPGCGKSLLGSAIAGQLNLPILKLVGPELVAGVSGESERRMRDVFETACTNAPCVLFLDEIDAIAQKRENASKDMERRMVAQLLACLDDLNKGSHQVMVVGATNKPDVLDPALRRAGRFDREICMGIPDEKARVEILRVMCKDLKLAEDLSFELLARLTPGYVGADLLSLCREAAMYAVSRIFNLDKQSGDTLSTCNVLECLKDTTPFSDEKLQSLSIETGDFERAIPDIQPSAKREGFATIPDVTWDDVGALEKIREELSIAILGPVRNPDAFAALGLTRASGVLLAGPPGCGKTMLAKAIANESGINFISVKGPELLNMYVGESERAVRQCFERARNSSPCVIFFDELDSLCPRRSAVESSASARVVNQLLTELDGLESRKQVFVMAATNRPDIIDPAVLRPGRLDKTLYIGLPSPTDRVKILTTITKNGTKPTLDGGVCLETLALNERCEGFSGADLSALVREASLNAIRNSVTYEWNVITPRDQHLPIISVSQKNFNDAFSKVSPSISKKDRSMYEDMRKAFEDT